jgi:carboxylesterase
MTSPDPSRTRNNPGAALVLHGLGSTPESVESLRAAFEAASFETVAPLLPGHGGDPAQLGQYGFDDWVAVTGKELVALGIGRRPVVVAGLSAGATVALELARRFESLAAVVVVNPYLEPPAPEFLELLEGLEQAGVDSVPGIGGDVADPRGREPSAAFLPISCLRSLFSALEPLCAGLGEIRVPVLVATSRVDHVVPNSSSDLLVSRLRGPTVRLWLERSFHVATVDLDASWLAQRAVEFCRHRSWLVGDDPEPGLARQ